MEEELKNVNEGQTSGLEEEEIMGNKKEGIEHPPVRIFGEAIEAKPNKGHIPLKPMVEGKKGYTEEDSKQEEWEEYWTTSQPEQYTKPKSRAPAKKTLVTNPGFVWKGKISEGSSGPEGHLRVCDFGVDK